MEIKRRLGKIQKRLSPQIESMNVSQQMAQMCDRFEELLSYAEEKLERATARAETIGAQVQREKKEAADAIAELQKKEADEIAEDQNQQKAQPKPRKKAKKK